MVLVVVTDPSTRGSATPQADTPYPMRSKANSPQDQDESSMTRMTREMLARAEGFVWLIGRVLDQRRFAYHFGSGSADGVRRALDAYHAPDGGFAFGLEPDVRGPASQPVTMATALKLLDETGPAGRGDRSATVRLARQRQRSRRRDPSR